MIGLASSPTSSLSQSAAAYASSLPANENFEPCYFKTTMSEAESKRLAHSEYWNERYAEVGPDEQVHEWFRSFNVLESFLGRNLFQVRAPETAPQILHLGSGDSVRSVFPWRVAI